MKLKPQPVEITALEWKGHEENPELACFVARYDLSKEKYPVIGYETVLQCCGKMFGEHGRLKNIPLGQHGVVCPGQWIVTTVNLRTSVLESVRAMPWIDIERGYERLR